MSHQARHALFFIVTSFALATVLRAQQADAPGAAAQPEQSKPEASQAAPAANPPPSDHSSTPDPSPAEAPAASKTTQLPPVRVNAGPSPDILRSARNAGFKIKLANGTTHFCKTEAPVGTRFESETCLNEQQVSLWLIRAQAQKDKLMTLIGAPENSR
jgi:pyruvate/2-oxoglutarate dehydrogenase complex dihydrolipoamide acyltransferase (E2) component